MKRRRIRELEQRVAWLEGLLVVALEGVGDAHNRLNELTIATESVVTPMSEEVLHAVEAVEEMKRVFSGYVN